MAVEQEAAGQEDLGDSPLNHGTCRSASHQDWQSPPTQPKRNTHPPAPRAAGRRGGGGPGAGAADKPHPNTLPATLHTHQQTCRSAWLWRARNWRSSSMGTSPLSTDLKSAKRLEKGEASSSAAAAAGTTASVSIWSPPSAAAAAAGAPSAPAAAAGAAGASWSRRALT